MGKTLLLTEEGRKYLKSGLPEKNLIEALRNGPVGFEDAKRKIGDFGIAFQWAKKNGWVDVRDGKLRLAKEPSSIPEEEGLRRIDAGQAVGPEIVETLVRRNLAKFVVRGEVDELVGKDVTSLTPEMLKTGLWKRVGFKPFNVEFAGKKMYAGKRQPYNQFLSEVRQKLVELGFKEVKGRTIITEFWNFDALYQPQMHPARDWTQTYNLKRPEYGDLPSKGIVERVKAAHERGWKYKWDAGKASRLMPVAHDTAISPMVLSSKELEMPGKYFQIVRCYRPDVIDAKHGVEFNQMGGFVVDESLTFKHLLGLLKQFVRELIGPYPTKFTTAYFPFTEPSTEISVKHPELGWVESAGAGIFREELTRPLGVSAPVIAWGFGIDRLAMFKLGTSDIRDLFSTDLQWLREKAILR